MVTEIGEAVKVAAVFDTRVKVRPVKFSWKGRDYPVKEVTFTWQRSEGNATILHFAVTDGASLFELSYNQRDLRWTLENIEVI